MRFIILLCSLIVSSGALAEDLKLRVVDIGADGTWQVMFTLTEGDQIAYDDPSLLEPGMFEVLAGPSESALAPIAAQGATLTTMNAESLPFRVVVLLPNSDMFNGLQNDPGRPDAAGVRGAVGEALQRLPARADVNVWAALYNVNVDSLPEFDGARTAQLATELMAPQWVAPPSHFIEDPIRALDLGYSAFCRNAGGNFAVFLVAVTSSLTVHESDVLGPELERIGTLLEEESAGRLVVETIVYNPAFGDDVLLDPESDPVRFANGITPHSGTSRLVNSADGFRTAMGQVISEIEHSYILSFSNSDLPSDTDHVVRLRMTAGQAAESNLRSLRTP